MNDTNFSVGEEERQAADHGEDPGEGMDGGREVGGRDDLGSAFFNKLDGSHSHRCC